MLRKEFIKNISAGLVLPALVNNLSFSSSYAGESFADKLQPAIKDGGFEMENYWIWDPSVVKGEDGRYHMFASRWPKEIGFGNWVTNSEIVRAVADKPEGPYSFVEVVLGPRGKEWFDGLCTFNPRITKYNGQYLLYYVGVTYDFPVPNDAANIWANGLAQKAWMHKRAAVAVSSSVKGPWKRISHPLMEPRPGKWDASIISNPSPVVLPGGEIYLMYKSSPKGPEPPLMLGAAISKNGYNGPYERLSDGPLFDFKSTKDKESDVEDPFVWWNKDHYELIMKDRFGHICGEEGGGIHATSKNGVDWKLSSPVKAYSRTIKWNDGTVTHQANFERPFLLFENGSPTHLFAATGSGPKPYEVDKTWNMVIPLK
ncbi:glycoside hydrolase family protein [Niabella soli]|uniref:Glycosyl hydrolase family 43 n=1 Tax=Niabella soli DSM 19437 TaxID=929713 RepID=W0EVK1_9BACT|nr:glycoside hydrolase family protein [Niabella soli]AHF14817.1 hypothetical protein NIASO_05790 [Niabella soli DSM 19437]